MAMGTSYGLAALPWFISSLQLVVIFYCVLTLAVLTTYGKGDTYLHHISNLGAVKPGTRNSMLNGMAGQCLGLGVIEGPATGFADRGTGGGHDHGITHGRHPFGQEKTTKQLGPNPHATGCRR